MVLKVLVYESVRGIMYMSSFDLDDGKIRKDNVYMNEFCDFCRRRYGDISMIDKKTLDRCLEEYAEEHPDIVQMRRENYMSVICEADVLEAKARQDAWLEAKMLKSKALVSSSSSSGRR